MANQFTKLEVF